MTGIQPWMPGFESEQRRRDLSQFYTPIDLAERLWRWMARPCSGKRALRVLEPSAGRGALIVPLFTLGVPVSEVVAYDVDPGNVDALVQLIDPTKLVSEVRFRDFLSDPEPGRFAIAVTNTPFENDQDIDFAERCLGCCDAVGGIYPARMLHSEGRAQFWRHTDILRLAILSKRPRFGGEHSPATDFVCMDLARRTVARKQGEATSAAVEWWG